jgi:hypothetical protein
MVFTEQDVKQLLQESLHLAQSEPDRGKSTQKINQNRSRAWVGVLAEQFQKRYEGDPEIRVFSKHDYSNRKDFGLNELLYDIVVCRVGEVKSSVRGKTLLFIKEVLWQIESEFAHDSRKALVDFNKLVLGSAKNKLFIGSRAGKGKEKSFLSVLQPAAGYCTGDVYVGMIPHPSNWVDTDNNVHLWIFKK